MNVHETILFIQEAHSGQKYGNGPYWYHPNEVSYIALVFNQTVKYYPKVTNIINVALLHDVIEDTKYTASDLLEMGYSEEIVDAVVLLTKDNSLSYEDNISRIIESGNVLAMLVKYADNFVNYHSIMDSNKSPERKITNRKKYSISLNRLGGELGLRANYKE